MKKIYLDTCCYNRIFDDASHPTIHYEREIILGILELAHAGKVELLGSDILEKELSDITDIEKKEQIDLLYKCCNDKIKFNESIIERAEYICENSNIHHKDSLHLACAEAGNVDTLITVDKKFLNNAVRLPAKINVCNPDTWIREVVSYHV